MSSPLVIVYGGSGALGSVAVRLFKKHMYQVISIDLSSNGDADHSIVVPTKLQALTEQSAHITSEVSTLLSNKKADA
ncbi:hypothetical protein IWW38_005867, partial [Coemansia aciculifera]